MICLIGAFLGTIIGMLPGLGPISGVAILLPIAYAMKLPPESALILLATRVFGLRVRRRISAILINIAGRRRGGDDRPRRLPDGQNGLAGPALSISAVASFLGAIVATLGIVCLRADPRQLGAGLRAGQIFRADGAGLSCLGGLVGDSLLKAMVGVLIGLMLAPASASISNSGVYRYTFDLLHLSDGIPFIVVVIGLFAVSELMLMLQTHHGDVQPVEVTGRRCST